MNKKKSVIITIIVSFWFIYAITSVSKYVIELREFYQTYIEDRKKHVDFHLENSTTFLLNRKAKSLASTLGQARDIGEFDFYLLRENDQVLDYYVYSGNLADINYDYKILNHFIETDSYILKTIAIFNYKLTLGFNKTESRFIAKQLQTEKSSLLFDLFLVTGIVFLIVYFILKDILQLTKLLGSNDREQIKKMHGHSKEAETLIQATTGFEQSNQSLRIDNLQLANSVGPAIREELRSGKAPPYSFPCTLVRVDINGYTQLVLQKETQELLSVLNQYFCKSRDLIERYHGLIYQYVGDEIIFLFKESEKSPPARRALACVRSLFEMAENLKSPGLPNGVRLKASMGSGFLQFVKMDQGHSFSGLPLIESVRMLGQVSERTENSLIIYQDSMPDISDLCEASASKTIVFKGFQQESSLLEVKKFTSCNQALTRLPAKDVGKYFRSNEDLVEILKALRVLLSMGDEKRFFELASSLWNMNLTEGDPNVTNQFLALLQYCLDLKMDKKTECRTLSTVVSLSQNIHAEVTPDSDLSKALDRCDQSLDPRMRANTIMAKSFFGIEISDLEQKFNSPDNRLAANAIYVAGKKDFTNLLAEKVQDFIDSNQPRFIASGLYLIATLIDYHRTRDLVYLRANESLRTLARKVPDFADHPDPIVRARALKSLETIQQGAPLEN